MADYEATGDSPEVAALVLLDRVANSENVKFYPNPEHGQGATREWIFTAYAQCLKATKGLGVDSILKDG